MIAASISGVGDKLSAVKSQKYILAKQKLNEVVETMHKLQMGFQVPETQPFKGGEASRLAIQSHYELDKSKKCYVAVQSQALTKSQKSKKISTKNSNSVF